MGLYVQYGCGWAAQPLTWRNFDASPTLRFERIPLLGRLYVKNQTRFPLNVEYGDIVKGLPLGNNSCDALYACHVLEHLALDDFRTALNNSFNYLKPGASFRLIVPDLRKIAENYLKSSDPLSAHEFMRSSYLGLEKRPKGFFNVLKTILGNSAHLWMWDYFSMHSELYDGGFVDIRRCEFGDSKEEIFKDVEVRDRFIDAVAIEAKKPG